MKLLNFSRLFDNKTFCKIFSVVGAIIIWASITLTTKTDSDRTMRKVPINFSVAGTSVEALGLDIFERSEETVDIKLSGTRSNLNAASADDFDVSLSLGKVTTIGKQTLQIDVKLKDTSSNLKIVDYSPKYVQVNFDRTSTKTFDIETDISDMSAKEGYLLDKAYTSVQRVTITGPESAVKTISSCVAQLNTKSELLDKTITFSDVPLFLLDKKENKIINSNIIMDKEAVDVSIPVLKIKTLPVVAHFINKPETFDDKAFSYTLSANEIKVAGPEETINTMSQLEIRYADLKTILPGDMVTLPVELPNGFVNVDNVNSINISIPSKDFAKKSFIVKSFKLIGVPDNKEVSVVTKQLNNVVVIGSSNLISDMVRSDLVAEIDLSNTAISSGTTTVSATISAPGKTGVFWAYGNYEAVIKSN